MLPSVRAQMLLVGHRGLSHAAPENTLASIKLAFQHGASGVEFDVQRSADGELFLLHDDTLKRTANARARGRLARLAPATYEELLSQDVSSLSYWDFIRHVDVGFKDRPRRSFQRPCLLKEALGAVPEGRFALIEIKGGDTESARLALEMARSTPGAEGKIVFIGFDLDLMVYVKSGLLDAGLPGLQVVSVNEASSEASAIEHVLATSAAGLDAVDFQADKSIVTPRVVAAARERGLQIGVWVLRSSPGTEGVESVTNFHDLGVTFFTSDMPPDLLDWISALN